MTPTAPDSRFAPRSSTRFSDRSTRSGVWLSRTCCEALTDRFPQVILVTHVEMEGRAFDRKVIVAYDEKRGVSIVTDEPSGGEDVAA